MADGTVAEQVLPPDDQVLFTEPQTLGEVLLQVAPLVYRVR
jgi:hypothetical protein